MSGPATALPPAVALVSQAWAAQARWTILDTGFGTGQTFLELWHRWRTHAQRPTLLHYVGVLSLTEAQQLPTSLGGALGAALARQCYALEPGFHRLLLEDGQLSLTLCVGELHQVLAQQDMQAHSVLATAPGAAWDKWQLKVLARCCSRGAQLLFYPQAPDDKLLNEAGFATSATSATSLTSATSAQPARQPLAHAVYAPRWQLRRNQAPTPQSETTAMGERVAVIGAGMAGASVAHALALRGFQVDVYDAHPAPAGGASGLPVGLVVPHHSADDSPRSRMSRQGTRLMLQHASRLLECGQDWSPSGVLELSIAAHGLAEAEAEVLSQAAPARPKLTQAGTGWASPMDYGGTPGLWHPHAAWIKPSRLVQQWLKHPGIRFHGQTQVHTLQRPHGPWQLCDAQGQVLAEAQRVVLANAYGCVDMLGPWAAGAEAALPSGLAWVANVLAKVAAMQRMHGTLSYGLCPAPQGSEANALPAFPVNGHGSFVPGVPTEQGPCWYSGATFETDASQHANLPQAHAANLQKLQTLLPAVAQALSPQFARQEVGAWQGSRCISQDRLPLVGPLVEGAAPTLWLCAGMGARGLSFSALCAELLVAELCGEPLPLESKLAKSLSTRRPHRSRLVPPRSADAAR